MKEAWHKRAKHHLIPNEANDHTPRLLRHHHLFSYGVFMVALKALVLASTLFLPSSIAFSSAITPSAIFSMANQARLASGLPVLAADETLTTIAQFKAEDMAIKRYFSHVTSSGLTPGEWARQFGYHYDVIGENLAVHFSEAEDVQAAWMASPSHRANILDRRFEELGVGVARGSFQGSPTTFVVQYFGNPRDGEASATAVPVIARTMPPVTGEPVQGDAGAAFGPREAAQDMPDAMTLPGDSNAPELFAPGADISASSHRLPSWLTVEWVNGLANGFYAYMIAMLSLLAALMVVIRFEIQRHGVLAHCLLVINLALLLMLV